MFVQNESHRQSSFSNDIQHLPDFLLNQLEQGWAGVFYREVFCRIPEPLFAELYSDQASRPNIPVNVLVGLQMLKAAHGWSDAEMYENFCYNLQVRYALGYRNLAEGYFCIRSYYYFTSRLVKHCERTGEDLILKAFEQITDEQIKAFSIKSSHLRMDSTQIASNIRSYSRLQLLVEIVQRQHRALTEADQERYAELLSPYLKSSSSHYMYHLKGDYEDHLLEIGQVMAQLVAELKPSYADTLVYQQLVRVFREHFVVEPNLRPKDKSELASGNLQSPDDDEATYRRKKDQGYTGYVLNVSETCDEENPHQMIVGVQLEPNNVDDPELLQDALPNLTERTEVQRMTTDGGYGSPEVDEALREADIELTQTAIRGRTPNPDRFSLADCEIICDPESQQPIGLIAPNGQTASVEPGNKPGRFIARFDKSSQTDEPHPDPIPETPLEETVPPQPEPPTAEPHPDPMPEPLSEETALPQPEPHTEEPLSEIEPETKPQPPPVLYFSQADLDLARRRQRLHQFQQTKGNPRAAIEATIGAIKRPFHNDTLPVRGKIRALSMIIGAAIMVNLRRITHYQNQIGSQTNNTHLSERLFAHLTLSLRTLISLCFRPIYTSTVLPLF